MAEEGDGATRDWGAYRYRSQNGLRSKDDFRVWMIENKNKNKNTNTKVVVLKQLP